MLSLRRFLYSKRTRGFTLIELLVSLSIMIIITGIARFGKSRYERSILLTNLAYDVALSIREAQVYGINVRSAGGNAPFDAGYGIHFSTASPGDTFSLFADTNNDHFYSVLEKVRDYKIKNNNKISRLCTVSINQSACVDIPSGSLDITFRRPDPNACFNGTGSAVANAIPTSDCINATGKSQAQITVSADDGSTRIIYVFSTGQISLSP